ncbi:FAD-dependent oxidoreductase [Plantibacter sp. CFBP 13570]|uniref:FAD-dependent oxidoreductase n=1 Tax=Plantibacter sp. CFBP 13570 TaxID=2775272 RepID=UPI00193090AF|nr:FAD-dependent oxidoreductase [Plantibacter sp. CFBP 13570]MBD8534538.1 FAD-dependent oxidoreductase [Plantibacter sp. CFBP 13570]
MRIVIVGGVAGGMSAAARARRLHEGAEIIVLDRGQHVSFANCGLPYYVGGEIESADSLLVQTPESLRKALNLDVRTNHEVRSIDARSRTLTVQTPDGIEQITYDALVLSPGAVAVRPDIPGLDSPRVRTLRTVADAVELRNRLEAGARHAVVLGSGFIGVEAAESLAGAEVRVTLVGRASRLLSPLEEEFEMELSAELRRIGVELRDGTTAMAVESGEASDVVVLSDGSRVSADIIVLATGVRPDIGFVEEAGIVVGDGGIIVDDHGQTSDPHIWAVGDAAVSIDAITGVRRPVALAGPANRAGRLVADHILSPADARPIPTAMGTAIVRVGDLAAALTGANRTELRAAGIAFETVHLHPNQHAGYFPGASQVHLIVHFASRDGRLLGAQALGREGVDKRIDVLATALRAGMRVEDLVDLDLAYSPPFGQAKDPVNLVGMVGANVRSGMLRLWYAQDLESVRDFALVLDVRTRAEVAADPVPGTMNVPHAELRDRLDEVRRDAAGRPVRVFCASGVRSHIVHRILSQSGFDSASLSGGIATLRGLRADRGELVRA